MHASLRAPDRIRLSAWVRYASLLYAARCAELIVLSEGVGAALRFAFERSLFNVTPVLRRQHAPALAAGRWLYRQGKVASTDWNFRDGLLGQGKLQFRRTKKLQCVYVKKFVHT